MSDQLNKYLKQLDIAFADDTATALDLAAKGRKTFSLVSAFLTKRNMIKPGADEYISASNESISLETAMNSTGVDAIKDLVLPKSAARASSL